MEQSCWGNMPPEILREVLITLEKSESEWPNRSNVIACAGVCRNWREIMKEIVKTPVFNGRITFPISIKQPGPPDNIIKCFIKRNRSMQTYHLYLSLTNALAEDGKFLLAARKLRRATYNDYVISFHADDMMKGGSTCIGKLRSNFLGTKFTIYDSQLPHVGTKMKRSCSARIIGPRMVSPSASVGSYAVAHITYDSNVVGYRGPRRMVCVMDAIPVSAIETGVGVAPTPTQLPLSSLESFSHFPFFRSKSNRSDDNRSRGLPQADSGALRLRNKAPRWHEQLQCWCLNFHGRVTVASVKNFQLVVSPEDGCVGAQNDKVILQFGKVGKDVFTMDYCYPISAFQAFAICLSSFDTKINCE
ncbi:Tubby-like F-box protein 6 [Bienertia sinuspersici]